MRAELDCWPACKVASRNQRPPRSATGTLATVVAEEQTVASKSATAKGSARYVVASDAFGEELDELIDLLATTRGKGSR